MALDANPDPIIYKARTCTKKAKDTHKNGEFLIKVSEQERDKFVTQEQQYEKELESLTKEKEKYEKEKREKETQKNSLEAQLHALTVNQDNCQRAFNDAQSRKHDADNSLRKARDKLEKEKRDKERAQGTGAVLGTFLFPPFGGLIGGALGAGAGAVVASSDVNQAENQISGCQK
uniref:Uncharacterized protein n=1 Tax=Amphimedon queenslandica TaxID=400682 RepID=A0A1X7TNA6_AMPQE